MPKAEAWVDIPTGPWPSIAVHKFDLLFVTCSMMLAPSTYRRTSTFRLASEPYLADMRVAFPGWYTDMSHGLMNLGVRDDEWIPFATWKPGSQCQ